MSPAGPSRHIPLPHELGRYRAKADVALSLHPDGFMSTRPRHLDRRTSLSGSHLCGQGKTGIHYSAEPTGLDNRASRHAHQGSAERKLSNMERRCSKAVGITHLTSRRGPPHALDPYQDRNLPPRHQLLLLTASSNGRLLRKVPGRILASCNAWSPRASQWAGIWRHP